MRALPAIADDDPITLGEASGIVLRGAVSEQTLRAEARRGRLQVERLGKNLFTTAAYIKAWRRECRVQQSHPACTSDRTAGKGSGSSATATGTDELAVLKATATALKNGSLNTCKRNTRRDQARAAEVMPFPSRR